MSFKDNEVKDILDKYKNKIKKSDKFEELDINPDFSTEYTIFREHYISKKLSIYEKLCNKFESVIRVRPKDAEYKKLEESIKFTHLNITPIGADSFGALRDLFCFIFAFDYCACRIDCSKTNYKHTS